MPRNGGRAERGAFRSSPPPGGTAALAQQTPATQMLTVVAGGFRAPTRYTAGGFAPRKRKRKSSRGSFARFSRKSSRKRSSRKAAHLVKGSAAAKRHMAKLRRMQKRKR